jgi:hypothetical protein
MTDKGDMKVPRVLSVLIIVVLHFTKSSQLFAQGLQSLSGRHSAVTERWLKSILAEENLIAITASLEPGLPAILTGCNLDTETPSFNHEVQAICTETRSETTINLPSATEGKFKKFPITRQIYRDLIGLDPILVKYFEQNGIPLKDGQISILAWTGNDNSSLLFSFP